MINIIYKSVYLILYESNKVNGINTLEYIKVFDLNGNIIKEMNNSNYSTLFVDTYYDKKLSKNFIITGNKGFSQSYDYIENKLYFKYAENYQETYFHMSIIIDDSEKLIKLMESSCIGVIRIWDFHSADLLNKIKVSNEWLNSICLWNKDYLFVGCKDNTIKLIDLNTNEIVNILKGHNKRILTIKKIIHPKYGEYLISQEADEGHIKLWKIPH